jgi:hypothetical protein
MNDDELLSQIYAVEVVSIPDEALPDVITQPVVNEANTNLGTDAHLTHIDNLPQPGNPDQTTSAYRIGPDTAYRKSQRIWIPLEPGQDAATVTILYYKDSEPNQGWHNAEDVVAFLATNERQILELENTRHLGIQVRHGATIKLSN